MFTLNPNITLGLDIAAVLSLSVAMVLLLRRNLMMLQQNSYRRERYIRWLRKSGDTTSLASLTAAVLFFMLLYGMKAVVAAPVLICYGILRTYELATRKYKKPLVMTARAARIFAVDLILTVGIVVAASFSFHGQDAASWLYPAMVALTGSVFLAHVITMVAQWLLTPVDAHINHVFYKKAEERLRSMPDLLVIGITGSYGKTSTKHYLERILSEEFDTLITPGSFNTTLGVVRTVNEHLKPYHRVFIAEMGAKQKGDIAEICRLTHPRIGILTAVGPQHLETFGTIENVRDTKFELVDALPADGLAVVNNDFEQICHRKIDNVPSVRYGITDPDGCQYIASDIRYSRTGTEFTVLGGDKPLQLRTSLLGECNISNLLAAVVVARYLGMSDEKIAYAVQGIHPVEHRLSTKPGPSGSVIIDDAFNSNPAGSRMALDVLAMMTGGKRIVITPGMIELGERQAELNRALGQHIAASADFAAIVGEYNRDAILEGLAEGGMDAGHILTFDTFNNAYASIARQVGPGDTILIENDLPDTFK